MASKESSSESETPPAKRKCFYSQKYLEKWESDPKFSGWISKSDKGPMYYYCKVCGKDGKAGKSELEKHATGKKHISNVEARQKTVSVFSMPGFSGKSRQEKQVKEGEIRLAAFISEHNVPFTSMEHLVPLIKAVCPDSEIAKKLQCGRVFPVAHEQGGEEGPRAGTREAGGSRRQGRAVKVTWRRQRGGTDPMAGQTQSLSRFVHWGRNVVAVGRNYRDHCAELGNAVPTKPMLFMKPPSCYLEEGKGPILIPRGCKDFHHEVELAVVIGETCRDVPEGEVASKVAGYALALDMTARDFQEEAKAKGNPWTMAKCFDTALPVSRFIPKEELQDPGNVRIWCKVNGKARQDGNTSDMVFPVSTLIAYITRYFTLHPGDLVLTGTPAGVGPVSPGDTLSAGLGDFLTMEFSVAQRE